ncbi:hypothetical protein [Aliivibrio fischeri]|uniref:hypothetical protein n=1 Tax=Aliivibrio fischeri TaxID=668 RepID=UPI0012D8E905|nr:hypothetical protein [Aliivibrio fischeri]MUJ21753.1 hypothetical protein [Aliivibrio fischeri]
MSINIGRLIVLFQALLGVINSYLIIKVFGLGITSDTFFLSMAIMFSFYLFLVMPFEQFIFYFHKEKSKKNEDKYISYQYILSLLVCVIGFILFMILKQFLISIYTTDSELSVNITNTINYLFIGYAIYPICYVIEKHASSIGKINSSIMLELTPNIGVFLGLIISIFHGIESLSFIFIIRSIFIYIELLIGVFLIKKIKFDFNLEYAKSQWFTSSLYSNKVKLIKTLPTIIIEVMISRVLSNYSQGYISIYYYANRFAVILKQIVIGPSFKIYQNKISDNISKSNIKDMFNNIYTYIKESLLIYTFTAIILYFLIPQVFMFVGVDKLSVDDVEKIKDFFVVLSCTQVLIIIENSISFIMFSMEKIKVMMFSYLSSTSAFLMSLNVGDFFYSTKPLFIIGSSLIVFYLFMVLINLFGGYCEKNRIL